MLVTLWSVCITRSVTSQFKAKVTNIKVPFERDLSKSGFTFTGDGVYLLLNSVSKNPVVELPCQHQHHQLMKVETVVEDGPVSGFVTVTVTLLPFGHRSLLTMILGL